MNVEDELEGPFNVFTINIHVQLARLSGSSPRHWWIPCDRLSSISAGVVTMATVGKVGRVTWVDKK